MIEIKDYVINSADLGNENPLPDIKNVSYIHAGYNATDKISDEEKKYFGKGMINTILPYTLQDGYNRNRKPKVFKSVQLENEYLKAVFLPELGGRLWSLYDKVGKRELLYKNTVFQPANLALRNAWFSGGIEFNVSVKGHNFLTCSPLFADIIELENGEQALHLYEFERIREITYSIVAYLPKGSKYLYLKEIVENNSNKEKFIYWWSNIAVPETKGTRIIVPTDETFVSSYNEGSYVIDKIPVPTYNGKDLSYPCNSVRSQDYFYKIPDSSAKWIAAVDENGKGLVQFSNKEMIGRKLFVWGMGNGGRHWGEWLSEPGQAYIEIQAGIARTQLEHIPFKAGEILSWVECYGAIDCNADNVHSDNWKIAQKEVENNSLLNLSPNALEDHLESVFPKIDFSKRKRLMLGSGWGYIENKIRETLGQSKVSIYCDFPRESVGSKEENWLNLLENGRFRKTDPTEYPNSYVSNAFWKKYLEDALNKQGNSKWYIYYHLGVLSYINSDIENALDFFEKSISETENPWSYRNIAMIYLKEKHNDDLALLNIDKAFKILPSCKSIAVNVAEIYIKCKKYKEYIDLFNNFGDELKKCGRLLLYKSVSLIELDRIEEAKEIVNEDFMMSDIQEGELSISYCWFVLYQKIISKETGIKDAETLKKLQCKKYPLPKSLDYRMHE